MLEMYSLRVAELRHRVAEIKEERKSYLSEKTTISSHYKNVAENAQRRALYSDIELLRMDIEENIPDEKVSGDAASEAISINHNKNTNPATSTTPLLPSTITRRTFSDAERGAIPVISTSTSATSVSGINGVNNNAKEMLLEALTVMGNDLTLVHAQPSPAPHPLLTPLWPILVMLEGAYRFVCVFGCMATLAVVVAPVVLLGKSWSFHWARQGAMAHALNQTNSNNNNKNKNKNGYRPKTHPVVLIKRWVGHVLLASAGVLLQVENEWEEGEDGGDFNHNSHSHNHSSNKYAGVNPNIADAQDPGAISFWNQLSSLSLPFLSSSSSSSSATRGYRSIPDSDHHTSSSASTSSSATSFHNNNTNNNNNNNNNNHNHSSNRVSSQGGGVLWTSSDLWPECLLPPSSPGPGAVTDSHPSPCPRSVMVFFTHASSLDAFIVAATIPLWNHALSKSELFLIPYFSCLLAALGGVAIDRRDRNKAIRTLDRLNAAQGQGLGPRQGTETGTTQDSTTSFSSVSSPPVSSSSSSPPSPLVLPPIDCIAVAPEGTRSLTGQLLSFKKGPFYLWQQLPTYPLNNHVTSRSSSSPAPSAGANPSPSPGPSAGTNPSPSSSVYSGRVIVPMVIYGAYDLLPPPSAPGSSFMNHPGQVTVRFLRPIFDSDLERYRSQMITSSSGPGLGQGLAPGQGPGQDQTSGPGIEIEIGGEGLGWERKAMARLVRRRMLLALRRAPITAGAPLTRPQTLYCTFCAIMSLISTLLLCQLVHYITATLLGWSLVHTAVVMGLVSMGSTLAVFWWETKGKDMVMGG